MSAALASGSIIQWDALEWEKDPPATDWDRVLAELGGHPLQSCRWGDARHAVDGIVQHRWLARRAGQPVWMIRVEERKTFGAKIAWAPRGPAGRTAAMSLSVPPGFDARLRAEGFSLLVSDPWIEIGGGNSADGKGGASGRPRTIWLDLSLGKDGIFKRMHEHVRNGIRRAAKAGVQVETTQDRERIDEFAALCASISKRKGFELRLTAALIDRLLCDSRSRNDVDAVLFLALQRGRLGAGLFILRVGRSAHLIGAATDRALRRDRVGEACQWGVIEWAIARGCTRYDLEGIDPVNNPSVYEFKKRLGGEEVILCGHEHRPLNLLGRAMSGFIRLGGRG